MKQIQHRSLSDRVVQIILQSRMLLDEDMDYILLHYKSTDMPPKNTLTTIQKVLSGMSIASIVFLIQQRSSIGYVSVAAAPLAIVAFQHANQVLYRRRQIQNMEIFVKVIADICKMNRDIVKYLKQKPSSNTGNDVNMYTGNVETLMEVLFKEETQLLKIYKKFVGKLASYMPMLWTDYFQLLNNIELEEFSTSNINDINGCVTYVSKLCDIYLLIASNTLTALAVTISSNVLNKYHISVGNMLDTIMPLKNQSLGCYKAISNKFEDIKYHYLDKNKFKINFKPRKVDSSSRLYLNTYNMLAQCSDIVEKSHIIVKKLEKHPLRTFNEKKLLHDCVSELCGQVCGYYESLIILQKLYEVDINKSLSVATFTRNAGMQECVKFSEKSVNMIDASLHSTEPATDEEFELFIGGDSDDTDFEAKDYSYYEEESRKYAAVLSRELKQKLKEHSGFRAAQQKRGVINEEAEDITTSYAEAHIQPPKPVPPPEPPRPPLNTVRYNVQSSCMPPPPPPLLPVFSMGPSGDTLQHSQTALNSLQSIRAISSSRQMNEDVFEDCEDDNIN